MFTNLAILGAPHCRTMKCSSKNDVRSLGVWGTLWGTLHPTASGSDFFCTSLYGKKILQISFILVDVHRISIDSEDILIRHYIPSGKLPKLWKITMFNGKIHYKWPYSVAMLNCKRVSPHLLTATAVTPWIQR